MSTTRILTIFAAVLYLVFWLAVIAVSIYLLSLIIRALKKYINSGDEYSGPKWATVRSKSTAIK